jgi:hypothetical protein
MIKIRKDLVKSMFDETDSYSVFISNLQEITLLIFANINLIENDNFSNEMYNFFKRLTLLGYQIRISHFQKLLDNPPPPYLKDGYKFTTFDIIKG